jgi:FixJ family two-component response regulator
MIFIIDDDYAVRDSLCLVMETAGFPYLTYASAELFLQSYCSCKHDCLLLDVNMPGMNGLELQDELIRRNINLPIIFISGQTDASIEKRAKKAGAAGFLTKPVS